MLRNEAELFRSRKPSVKYRFHLNLEKNKIYV